MPKISPILPVLDDVQAVPVGVDLENPWKAAQEAGEQAPELEFGRARQAYSNIDGTPAFNAKLDQAICQHGQFLDAVYGHTVICLDCGHEVSIAPQPIPDQPGEFLAPWSVLIGGKVLANEELQAARDRHDAIWFGEAFG
jgi:hypothetical protein